MPVPEPVRLAALAERAAGLVRDGRRAFVGLAGPPGAGKSTLAVELASRLGARAAVVPMDGFHLADAELSRLDRLQRKGAPDTFDAAGYVALLRRLHERGGETVYAPEFSRALEAAIAGSIPVGPEIDLVVTEGNYLLADGPFAPVRRLLDEVWFLDLPQAVRHERLLRRQVSHGRSPDAAQAWVRDTDEVNARLVAATRHLADLVVRVPESLGVVGWHRSHEALADGDR